MRNRSMIAGVAVLILAVAGFCPAAAEINSGSGFRASDNFVVEDVLGGLTGPLAASDNWQMSAGPLNPEFVRHGGLQHSVVCRGWQRACRHPRGPHLPPERVGKQGRLGGRAGDASDQQPGRALHPAAEADPALQRPAAARGVEDGRKVLGGGPAGETPASTEPSA